MNRAGLPGTRDRVHGPAGDDGGGLAVWCALHPCRTRSPISAARSAGTCTPGILMTASALLAREPNPTRDQIADALAGNLCRCTGYLQILEAVEAAAARMREPAR
ncbi:MAG: 2Fe-2S iron-sulfur cluster-binding protein [Vicinamibacterales bacterium]